MVLDIDMLVTWIGAVGAISAPILFITKKINALIKSVNDLKSWNLKQQEDIDTSHEERGILLSGQLACLKGLQEQGCNGPVTKSIDEIETFLKKQAHIGKSKKAV